jgi:TolB protein
MKKLLSTLCLLVASFIYIGCSNSNVTAPEAQPPTSSSLGSEIVYGWAGKAATYLVGSKASSTIRPNLIQPEKLGDGSLLGTSEYYEYLFLWNANGTRLDTLVKGQTNSLFSPHVSPDGKKLSFSYYNGYFSTRTFDTNGTYVFAFENGKLGELLALYPDLYDATWTGDGRLIMSGGLYQGSPAGDYVRSTGFKGIYLTDDATLSSATRIDPGLDNPLPATPVVSPDGKQVALYLNQHIWVMNIDGSNLHQLSAASGDNEDSFPEWSPNGKYIGFWCYRTFEVTYYTALAYVPSNGVNVSVKPEDAVWFREDDGDRLSGGCGPFLWR